jgi:hypothetical protein
VAQTLLRFTAQSQGPVLTRDGLSQIRACDHVPMDGAQPSLDELPIACTLGLDDGAARMQRWRALSAKAHPNARRDGDQLVVRYRSEPGVREELDALAAAERECCSFADWEVAQERGHVVLRIVSNTDGIAALAELFLVRSG